ncbi:MAG: HD-GYP domain-containing protein [Nitrospinota bacterium]
MRRLVYCQRLVKKEELLGSLGGLMERLGDTGDVEEVFRRLVAWSADLVDGRRACLFLLERSSQNLVLRAAHGEMPNFQILSPMLLGEGWEKLLGTEGYRVAPAAELAGLENERAGGWLLAPMVIRDQLFGVMMVEQKAEARFGEIDLGVLLSFTRTAGLALENNFLYRQIFRGLAEALQFLVSTLEARDPYTKDHSVRVTRYALMMADVLECTAAEREMLDFAGRLHDIGKVGIQDIVLLKPGRLNSVEVENMRRHPVIGEEIVRPVCLLAEERAVVRHHHEWWNGMGYPDRLAGAEIPLLARILSVADAFDAMTSDRPYRRALTPRQAMSVLGDFSDVQFDSKVVQAFRHTDAGEMAAANAKHDGRNLDVSSPVSAY